MEYNSNNEELEATKALISKLPPEKLEEVVGGMSPHVRNILIAAGLLIGVTTTGLIVANKFGKKSGAVGNVSVSSSANYRPTAEAIGPRSNVISSANATKANDLRKNLSSAEKKEADNIMRMSPPEQQKALKTASPRVRKYIMAALGIGALGGAAIYGGKVLFDNYFKTGGVGGTPVNKGKPSVPQNVGSYMPKSLLNAEGREISTRGEKPATSGNPRVGSGLKTPSSVSGNSVGSRTPVNKGKPSVPQNVGSYMPKSLLSAEGREISTRGEKPATSGNPRVGSGLETPSSVSGNSVGSRTPVNKGQPSVTKNGGDYLQKPLLSAEGREISTRGEKPATSGNPSGGGVAAKPKENPSKQTKKYEEPKGKQPEEYKESKVEWFDVRIKGTPQRVAISKALIDAVGRENLFKKSTYYESGWLGPKTKKDFFEYDGDKKIYLMSQCNNANRWGLEPTEGEYGVPYGALKDN